MGNTECRSRRHLPAPVAGADLTAEQAAAILRLHGSKLQPSRSTTNYASDNERRQALAGGAVDLLLKPFSEDALLAAIQTR